MRVALLTGAAAIVLAGLTGMATAQTVTNPAQTHVLNVRLPNGQVEQIRYTGDVPPTVMLAPDAAMDTVMPAFGPGSPFAMLQRMSADMDRQAAALFHDVGAMPMNVGPMNAGGFGVIPAMSGPGVCMRSVQVTFTGNGQAPHVVSQTSGDCGPAHGSAAPVMLPSAPVRHGVAPDVILAKADTRTPG
ncbi:hypothetical protein [Acidisphaera sp. S103]|uniref:hypothetical protein n=1 Tax=Acidisphaera sp. S103 TaxID=1747223 RepID=UPI00131AAF01|nr:hypothetical protein [Acidisphaera sp. S103]